MKKPSIGVVIFGVIFILIGLKCLVNAPLMYFTYRSMAPVIYETVTAKISETENLMETKKTDTKPAILAKAQTELKSIKQQMHEYEINYVTHKVIPLHIVLVLFALLVSAGIFIYTGIAILQLKHYARKWITGSFLTGLLLSLFVLYGVGASVLFIATLTERFSSIIYQITGNSTFQGNRFSELTDLFLFSPGSKLIVTSLMIYLAFMAITSIFFARTKVKEQFK